LVNDVRKIEGFNKTGEFGALDSRDDRGTEGADKEGVGIANEVWGLIEDGYTNVVPLSVSLLVELGI